MLRGLTDCHCHLLPGVDDGVRTMSESLETLSAMERLGIRTVWLTPHVMEDVPNETARLRERFSELCAAYRGGLTLRLAAENMLDRLFWERLAAGDVLPLGGRGDHLLVETSCLAPPVGLLSVLERIKSGGYFPLLAHPERYVYMDDADYRRLHGMGVKFQLNLPSLAGMYGPAVRRKALRLLRGGMAACAGTDTHSLGMFQRLAGGKIEGGVRKQISNN